MATILQQYREKQQSFCSQINSGNLPLEKVIEMQEVNYRICVLETFESFCKTAPITTDNKAMGYHYQLVDAYVRFVLSERKFGARTDADGAKKRETAYASLEKVALDGKKRFSNFVPGNDKQYKEAISNYIKTILPVWMQYRNMYINI